VASDGTRAHPARAAPLLVGSSRVDEVAAWLRRQAFLGNVRRHVLQAAENKVACGEALRDRLYVPEVFSVEHRDEINSRRVAQWMHGNSRPGSARNLMLVIAEVKEIVQARYGFKAVLKHIPDQAFALDPVLYRRMAKRFEGELSLWGASDNLHMVMIATFDINDAGVPTFEELSLMPTSGEWIPFDNRFELILVESMVGTSRRFLKTLRYNAPSDAMAASAVLLDTGGEPCPLYISSIRSPANRHHRPPMTLPPGCGMSAGRDAIAANCRNTLASLRVEAQCGPECSAIGPESRGPAHDGQRAVSPSVFPPESRCG
jgi:hypothetical protein